jgi:hypothetical protein
MSDDPRLIVQKTRAELAVDMSNAIIERVNSMQPIDPVYCRGWVNLLVDGGMGVQRDIDRRRNNARKRRSRERRARANSQDVPGGRQAPDTP